jgi:glucuronate isomerase
MALLDPDRLFPTDPRVCDIARALHAEVRDLPVISPHGHTDPRWYAENEAFTDPAQLFVTGRLAKDGAFEVAHDLAYRLAKQAYKL